MNKRQSKKLLHRVLCNVRKINSRDVDNILVRYSTVDLSFVEINNIVKAIRNHFPNNTVIAIPNKISLNTCTDKDLEKIISVIKEQLKI